MTLHISSMRDCRGVLRGACTLCVDDPCEEFTCAGSVEKVVCQYCGCPPQKHTRLDNVPLIGLRQPHNNNHNTHNGNNQYYDLNNLHKIRSKDQVEQEKAEKCGQLKEEFISNVTLHGYRYLFVTKGFRRLIWISCFVAAIIVSIFLFFDSIVDYYKYKTFTLTQIDYNIESLEFPTITLCNENAFIDSKYDTFPIKGLTVKEFRDMYDEIVAGIRQPSDATKRHLKSLEQINITTYEQLIKLFETNHEDIFHNKIANLFHRGVSHEKSCSFHGQPCGEDVVVDTMQWRGSLCQSFNFFNPNRPALTQSSTLGDMGFHNFLNILSSEAIKDTSATGVSVFIHPYGTPSTDAYFIDKVNVHPGVVNRIMLDQRKLTLLPAPYGNCGSVGYNIVKHYPYSHAMCHIDCALVYIVQRCGCLGFELKGFIGDIPICTIMQMSSCYLHAVKEAYQHTKKCQDNCLLECVIYKYTIRMDSLSLGSHSRYTELENLPGWSNSSSATNRMETITYIKENIVGIEVGYRQMLQMRETMTPSVTMTSLMGSIGGSIGLGIGLSMLTIVEFLIFIFDYLCVFFSSGTMKTTDL